MVLGLAGLSSQGLRCVDEGNYCYHGMAVLEGIERGVLHNPGHALLVACGYQIFGFSMGAALMVSGILGMVSVVLIYVCVRQVEGNIAPGVSAFFFSCSPHLLFYSRSVYSESNYIFFFLAGLACSLWAWKILQGAETNRRGVRIWIGFWLAGLLWGMGATVNLACIPMFGLYQAGSLVAWCLKKNRQWKRLLFSYVLVGLGCMIGYLVVVLPLVLTGILDPFRYIPLVQWHAEVASDFKINPMALAIPIRYGLGIPLILAILGGRRLWREGVLGQQLVVLGMGLILFYIRMPKSMPRIFLPVSVVLLLLSGPGWVDVWDWLRRRCSESFQFMGTILLASCFLVMVIWAKKTQPPRSGYEEACQWLMKEELGSLVSTHSWWTFSTFVGQRTGFASEVIARALQSEDSRERLLRFFRQSYERGYSHLVLDYLLWNQMRGCFSGKFSEFLNEFPPNATIPNLVARHEQTFLEDGELPNMTLEPLSWNIYIYRLDRFSSE